MEKREHRSPRPRKNKPTRDLSQAITLRPREVYELYGVAASTLHWYLMHPDPNIRLPSIHPPGRRGSRGIILIEKSDLSAWLAKHKCKP